MQGYNGGSKMRHLFIVNPNAGKKGSTEALVQKIKDTFTGADIAFDVQLTEGVGHAAKLARAAAETGENLRIYACGGDGTLNEVVNGAAGHDNVAITNVPKGTGNDFLRIFGPRAHDGFGDLAALSVGPESELDLMDCNGTLGIGITCAGVDARIAADVHHYKGLPLVTGMGAYIAALIVNVLFKGIARPMKVDMGQMHLDEEITIVCVCSGRFYGGGFQPVPDAQPDDGILDMLIVPKVSRFTFFRMVGQYAKGRYRELPQHIWYRKGTSITFSSEEEMVAVVDGEVLHDKSFTVCLSEQKVKFFYPAGLSWNDCLQTAHNSDEENLVKAR